MSARPALIARGTGTGPGAGGDAPGGFGSPDTWTVAGSGAAATAGAAVAVLLLFQARAGSRFWGWTRVMLRGRSVRGTPGLRFVRALGSGRDGGFGLAPSADRGGLFTLFDDDAAADAFIDRSPVVGGYRQRAAECWVARMRCSGSRGSWGGATMRVTVPPAAAGQPVAALTRGSIRLLQAPAFWRHAAPAQQALSAAAGCRLAVGLGEAPLLRQATFSLWDDEAALQAYARQGAHGAAARAAFQQGYFSESMFLRLVVQRCEGRWQGVDHG